MSPRKFMVQFAWQYDVTSRVRDFQNGEHGQSYRPVTLLRATRLRRLDSAIGGSSKDVLYFTLCVFSALQSYKNPISFLSKFA